MAEVAGYFCWNNINGKFYRSKHHVLGESVHPDTKKYFETIEVVKIPLSAEEYALSLSQLAAKYPLPEKFK